MAATAVTVTVPVVSPEVKTFAAERGVTEYLPGVLDMTGQVFGPRFVGIELVDDPEIADWRKIMMLIDVAGMKPKPLDDAWQKWTRDIFTVCPATHVHIFGFTFQ